MVRMRITYYGRVQGVGFRHTCVELARALPSRGHALSGWVRNEPDGSVTLEVQGPEGSVQALRDAIQASRLGILVQREMRESVPCLPGESSFVVAR